jgi:hypothetical protein
VNYLRMFAAEPAERTARPPRRPRPARKPLRDTVSDEL